MLPSSPESPAWLYPRGTRLLYRQFGGGDTKPGRVTVTLPVPLAPSLGLLPSWALRPSVTPELSDSSP